MKYTRATFEMTARVLKENLRTATADDARAIVAGIADDLASEFQRSNSRFDRGRFERACGLETEHVATANGRASSNGVTPRE